MCGSLGYFLFLIMIFKNKCTHFVYSMNARGGNRTQYLAPIAARLHWNMQKVQNILVHFYNFSSCPLVIVLTKLHLSVSMSQRPKAKLHLHFLQKMNNYCAHEPSTRGVTSRWCDCHCTLWPGIKQVCWKELSQTPKCIMLQTYLIKQKCPSVLKWPVLEKQ